jgi:HEAT repeat protein
VIADVDEVWRDLVDVARDRTVTAEGRKGALFWLGQEAADAATAGLAQVAGDEDEEQEIREAAVFALSQRPEGEGVPILMDLARTAREPETRRSALFWLAQADDDRVLDFFEQILLRRGSGG